MSVRPFILSAIAAASGASEFIPGGTNPLALSRVGMNLPGVNYYEPTNIYADAARHAPNFSALNNWSSGPPYPVSAVPLNAQGDPTASFSMILIANGVRRMAAGTYKGRFKGQATITKGPNGPDVTNKVYDPGTDTTTFDYVLGNTSGQLSFADLSGTFGEFKLMRPGHDFTDKYSDEFLSLYTRCSVIRFMDAQGTNVDPTVVWTTPSPAKFGMGLAEMCELANDLSKDSWFCIPHGANDGYISSFADYLRDNISTVKRIQVELSNEIWNVGFRQFADTIHIAAARAKILQTQETKTLRLDPLPRETQAASDDSNERAAFRIRRVGDEVYIRHSGTLSVQTGERYQVTSLGHASIASMMPAINSFVTVTAVAWNEFKYPLAGADVAEIAISGKVSAKPTFSHSPFISVTKTAGVVTLVHDGSATFGATCYLQGIGTVAAISGKDATNKLVPMVPTIMDATTVQFTLPIAGADLATVTSFSKTNAVILYCDASEALVRGDMYASSTYPVGLIRDQWIVTRTYEIAQAFATAFGPTWRSRIDVVLASQTGQFNYANGMRNALEWHATQNGIAPNTWLSYLSVAPYITIDTANLTAINADATGATGAASLLARAPTQYSGAVQGMIALAKTYGLKTSFYEAGFDTAQPSPTATFSIAAREAIQHNGAMRDASKALMDMGARFGVDQHMIYQGSISDRLDGTGTSIYVSWHLAETAQSLAPIGEITSENAPKLMGVDDYLLAPLPAKTGHYAVGDGLLSVETFQFFGRDPLGPNPPANPQVQTYTGQGGRLVVSNGDSTNGYAAPIMTFLVYSPVDQTANLVVNCKSDDRGLSLANYVTTLTISANGVVQGTLTNPNPVTGATYGSTGGFADSNPVAVELQAGANLVSIRMAGSTNRSHNFTLTGIKVSL